MVSNGRIELEAMSELAVIIRFTRSSGPDVDSARQHPQQGGPNRVCGSTHVRPDGRGRQLRWLAMLPVPVVHGRRVRRHQDHGCLARLSSANVIGLRSRPFLGGQWIEYTGCLSHDARQACLQAASPPRTATTQPDTPRG